MRLAHANIPGKHLLRQPIEIRAFSRSGYAADVTSMGLNEAVDVYLKLKGASKSKTFHAATHRACGYLVDACGMKHLHEYSRGDALAFRDALVARGLAGSSVSRVFNSVTAVFNFAVSEHALNISNPFTGVYHDRTAGVSKRHPIPLPDIRKVQTLCKKQDDDARWLIALVSDTGLRLAEAAGVLTNDLKVDAEIPHVIISPNSYRRLKTPGSERVVPLVGASLWAARRIVEMGGETEAPAFSRYNKNEETNANSASAALNKWLRPHVPTKCTMHSFRHSMRDRLRAVNCPTEMIDQIGGWAHDTVGQNYGSGYPLEQLQRFMLLACERQ